VRGDLLRYWEPDRALDPTGRRQWLQAAERIARGVQLLAHLDAFTDARTLRVGFALNGNTALAERYVEAIGRENVEARRSSPAPQPDSSSGGLGLRVMRRVLSRVAGSLPADEVLLPCGPEATSEEIKHVVLAALKASHALEFGIDLDQSDDYFN
jgi:hypothetical protein